MVMGEVKRTFNPEFINRLDEIIIFDALTDDDLVAHHPAAGRQLNLNLADKGAGASRSATRRRLAAAARRSSDRSYGARPLRRAHPAPHRGRALRGLHPRRRSGRQARRSRSAFPRMRSGTGRTGRGGALVGMKLLARRLRRRPRASRVALWLASPLRPRRRPTRPRRAHRDPRQPVPADATPSSIYVTTKLGDRLRAKRSCATTSAACGTPASSTTSASTSVNGTAGGKIVTFIVQERPGCRSWTTAAARRSPRRPSRTS